MAEHRIDRLRLRVHAAPGLDGEVKGTAERFVAGILEQLGDRLEARWPGRLFFLSDLKVRWIITGAELSDAPALARHAEEIVDGLGSPEPQRPGDGASESDVAVFRDEENWWACYLAAVASGDGAGGWAYEKLSARSIGLTSLAERGRGFATGVLRELAAAGMLEQVVRAGVRDNLTSLCGLLGASPNGVASPAADAELVAFARSLSSQLAGPALWIAIYGEASRIAGTTGALDEVARTADSVVAAISREGSAGVDDGVSTSGAGNLSEAESVETQFGGLFYLLTLALELEIGETLWKACLPEGLVLGHAASGLLGPAGHGDYAARLFGGIEALDQLDILPEQLEEVAAALLANLAAALPRRSLATLPQLMLQFVTLGGVRVLAGSEAANAFPLFLWPVANSRGVERCLGTLLTAWPASAPGILATPGIAELEGGVRIRPDAAAVMPLFTVEMGSPSSAALVSQVAGVLCHIFAARAGFRLLSAAELVERYFRVPARVTLSPGKMTVCMPMSRIENVLRRSGLDRDPGWIPWLGRTVRFEFDGGEEEAA